MKKVYLDYAAATPLDKRVLEAMHPYLTADFYNPSALYHPARRVKQALEAARAQVAQVLGAKPPEIIFTAGATESINLALRGLPGANGEIVTSAVEHEAVVAAAKASGHKVVVCPVEPSGLIDLSQLEKLLNQNTVALSIGYANSETGTIQPLAKIAKMIKTAVKGFGHPIYFHSDATQAANYLDLHVNRLGVDLLTLNGAKIYGPKQTGCLYIKSGVALQPLIYGGGQENGLRSGTENVAGIIGFAKALELASQLRAKETGRQQQLRDYFWHALNPQLSGVQLNGDRAQRLPNNLNISIKKVNGETLVHYLDQKGVMVATGAACSANKDTPSPVLAAMGLGPDQIDSSLRITLGRPTTKSQVDYLIWQLVEAADYLREQG